MHDDALFWPEFKRAGMLDEARTILPGCTSETVFDVRFGRPDVNQITGMQSSDYEIEFQYDDAPTLREGAQVIIGGAMFKVRAAPFVDPQRGDTGHFRTAYLTKEACE